MTISRLRRSKPLSAIALALALPACITDQADDTVAPTDEAAEAALADDVKEPPASALKLWDQGQAYDNVQVGPYYRQTLTMSAISGNHVIRTADLKQAGNLAPDTVIVAQSGPGQWTSDNCNTGTRASCVSVPGSLTSVTVAIFGRQPGANGTADLVIDDVVRVNDTPFGGTLISVNWLTDGTDFAIQTVGKAGGTTDETIFHLGNDFKYKDSNTSSGILAHAKLIATPVTGDYILVASPSTAPPASRNGVTRVLFNSCLSETDSCQGATAAFSGDSDGDGLANYLEAQIGTSASNRDTDGDGIFDYQEVIGLKLGADEEDLPLYGADPRHGDLFIEMDTSFWSGDAQDPPSSSDTPADQTIVARVAEMYAGLSRWSNPDGTTGIRVHVDGGGPCADATLCGDWGGSNHFEHRCGNPPTAETVKNNMAQLRHGIFHHTLRTCSGASSSGTVTLLTRIGPNNSAHEGEVWAHELGHHFGLMHSGDPDYPEENRLNYTAAYPSTMNYSFQHGAPGGGGIPAMPAQFSAGRMQSIRPENQNERDYSPGRDKGYLVNSSYRYTVTGDDVDFNGDGRISSTPVWFDPGPVGQRGGNWADMLDVRPITNLAPTGGVGIAVLPTVSGGSTSRVYIAAPYNHANGVYPEIQWATENVNGSPGSFSSRVASPPLPVGGDPSGEVAAALVIFESNPAVFVTMPGSNGRLYFAHFRTTNHTWTNWTQMPAWHPETRARQATVVNSQDRMYLLYRDINAAEGVPNVWMNTFEEGGWRGWSLLEVPSYFTPGLAIGPDERLYLLHMTHSASGGSVDIQLKLSHAEWAPWPQALDFTAVDNLTWPNDGFGSQPIAGTMRPRLNLLSAPYRQGGGAPFTDGSHQLIAYWASGVLGTAESLQGDWVLRRAYVPGYITPFVGPCFGATGCGTQGAIHTRYHKQTDRPWPAFSAAAAPRWNVVSTAYVQSFWDDDGSQDSTLESFPTPIAYQPWATGIYPGHPDIRDTNDAAVIRRNACKALWSLTGEQCKCDNSCGSRTRASFAAKSVEAEPHVCTPPDDQPLD
jgi:hypothetical protein